MYQEKEQVMILCSMLIYTNILINDSARRFVGFRAYASIKALSVVS